MAQEKKVYMQLSYLDLDPVIDEIAQGQEHLLIDMYRQELGRRFEQVTTFEEEKRILKQYFKGRFYPITDDVYRIITYPDNYQFDFDKNKNALIDQFITDQYKKVNASTYIPKTYGYNAFANKYLNLAKNSRPTFKIRKEHLKKYKDKFKKFVLDEINKDRNQKVIYITFSIDIEKYPEKQLYAIIDDTKELLSPYEVEDLDSKIKSLLKMMQGKVSIYCIESFVSFYLAEIAHVKCKKKTYVDKLAHYDDLIKYPEDEEMESPESFIGNLYDIIRKLPRGTKINNVETILRRDLIWRFKKYQAMLRDTYPTKKSLANIEIGFHGTREDRMISIVEKGLIVPNTNNGLDAFTTGARYGKGIYLSPDARFSMHYCRGDSCLLVCAILPGRKYTCGTDGRWNDSCQKGYDSHISVDGTEIVLFDEAQVLPCVVIHFSVTSLYMDWWDFVKNGYKEISGPKPGSYRDQMSKMNKKEKKEFLASFAQSHLSYGFGPLKDGKKCEFIDVSFPDEQDEEYQNEAVWYGERDEEHYNLFQHVRHE